MQDCRSIISPQLQLQGKNSTVVACLQLQDQEHSAPFLGASTARRSPLGFTRRLNLTPLLWPSPLGSWQTSASKATRAPAAPWVQDRRKGPARWTWQPQPCAASRSASTTSAGSRGLLTLTSHPHRGVRGSAAF
ncbi:hypothetical protein EYF80_013014 [Liparis tanakae]|uniref:Uncharacterized protein n=1 Tax=Liparis tanakae TaxID=230148 RepID=A0A4Z2IGH7_9TELE|nr:hypothetical protein EYF80_013014 [Liparis tanakae]